MQQMDRICRILAEACQNSYWEGSALNRIVTQLPECVAAKCEYTLFAREHSTMVKAAGYQAGHFSIEIFCDVHRKRSRSLVSLSKLPRAVIAKRVKAGFCEHQCVMISTADLCNFLPTEMRGNLDRGTLILRAAVSELPILVPPNRQCLLCFLAVNDG